jgi:hypothetical protein
MLRGHLMAHVGTWTKRHGDSLLAPSTERLS